MRKSLIVAMLLMLLSLSAFAADGQVEEVRLVGKCLLVGSSNFTIIQFSAEDGKKYSLEGDLEGELRHLQNIKIRILAMPAGRKQMYDNLRVLDYEILDVGKGVKPYFGTLILDGEKLVLSLRDAGDSFELVGNSKVLEKLAAGVGGRAWIKGDLKGKQLKVRKFRVLSAN